jgi:hypothetical protein
VGVEIIMRGWNLASILGLAGAGGLADHVTNVTDGECTRSLNAPPNPEISVPRVFWSHQLHHTAI